MATFIHYNSLPPMNEKEAITLRDALIWLCDLDIKDAIMETDCQQVMICVYSSKIDKF